MTVVERRALVATLRRGDVVQISDEVGSAMRGVGVVETRGHGGVVKVRVRASLIPFYPTGLERLSPRLTSRGRLVIAGRAAETRRA